MYLTKLNWLDGLDTQIKHKEFIQEAKDHDIRLFQNYPNPFSGQTCLNFAVTSHEHIFIEISDIKGHRVKVLMNEERPAGTYEITWDGTDHSNKAVSPGTYFCKIYTKSTAAVVKMILH